MSNNNFTVVVNLSNFFSDHRHRVRVFINDALKTIKDFQKKISNLFNVTDFILISQNEYLPPSEDIRIIHSDDIIWAVPIKTTSLQCENVSNEQCTPVEIKRKRSCNTNIDTSSKKNKYKKEAISHLETTSEVYSRIKKKKKKREKDVETSPKLKVKNKKGCDSLAKQLEGSLELNKCLEERDNTSVAKSNENTNTKPGQNSGSENISDLMDVNGEVDKDCESISNAANQLLSKKHDEISSVNVSTSAPNSIPYKKIIPIPTITTDYLKERKINVVRIDHISKPTHEEKVATGESITTVESLANVDSALISKPPQSECSETTGDNNREMSNFALSRNSQVPLITKPTTKYFFFNTPTSKEKGEQDKVIDKKKRENVFKPKKDVSASPLFETNVAPHISKLAEQSQESYQLNIDGQPDNNPDFHKLSNDPIPPVLIKAHVGSQNIFSFSPRKVDLLIDVNASKKEEHGLVEENHLRVPHENTSSQNSVTTNFDKNVTKTDHDNSIHFNGHVEHVRTNAHDQNILETKISGDDTTKCALEELQSNFHHNNTEETFAMNENSSYINNISPCIATPLNSYNGSFEISGLKPMSLRKHMKSISGIGALLENMRENEVSITPSTSEGDISEFITKRKRHRNRKRKKGKCETADETVPINDVKPETFKPMNTLSAPKQHIRFSNDEDYITENADIRNTDEFKEKDSLMMNSVEHIMKCPLIDKMPNVWEKIAFKVLKISAQSTPELTPYIIGNVVNVSTKDKILTIYICQGAEELKSSKEASYSITREFLWDELIDTRLLRKYV